MKNMIPNFLSAQCQAELQNKLNTIKATRPDFLKNLIFLEIRNKSLVELKEEYDIKIVLYLRCANRHFGLFVKSSLFDIKGDYKDIVRKNVIPYKVFLNETPNNIVKKDKTFNPPTLVSQDLPNLNYPISNSEDINYLKNVDNKIN